MRVKRPINLTRPPARFSVSSPLSSPTAFTLFEVLLVISMLSILMAMAWPAYDRMMEARRLTDGASQLRTLFRQARRSAIADGVVYRCDFLPESLRVRVVPLTDSLESDSATDEATPANSSPTDDFEPERIEEELPMGLRVISQEEFEKGPPEKEEGMMPEDQVPESDDTHGDSSMNSGSWKPLVQFSPDGSAEEVVVWLVDESQRAASLRVLSLTGEVEIGEVEDWLTESQREEIEQAEADRGAMENSSP